MKSYIKSVRLHTKTTHQPTLVLSSSRSAAVSFRTSSRSPVIVFCICSACSSMRSCMFTSSSFSCSRCTSACNYNKNVINILSNSETYHMTEEMAQNLRMWHMKTKAGPLLHGGGLQVRRWEEEGIQTYTLLQFTCHSHSITFPQIRHPTPFHHDAPSISSIPINLSITSPNIPSIWSSSYITSIKSFYPFLPIHFLPWYPLPHHPIRFHPNHPILPFLCLPKKPLPSHYILSFSIYPFSPLRASISDIIQHLYRAMYLTSLVMQMHTSINILQLKALLRHIQ